MQIKQWIAGGEIDVAIVFNSHFNAPSFIPLHRTPVVCFTPGDYVPRDGICMTAQDLRDLPVILRAEDFDQETNAILSRAGIPLDSVFRIDNDESCYEFIRQGFGFRITAAITYPQDGQIHRYPLENAPYRTIGLITAFPQYISPAVNLFRKETISFFVDSNLMNV